MKGDFAKIFIHYNNIEKKVYTLTKKLGFEFDDGEGVLDFGLDIRTLAQVIYLMCNSYYEDFQTENITYGLLDILPDDIARQYPMFSTSLLNLLRNAESRMQMN